MGLKRSEKADVRVLDETGAVDPEFRHHNPLLLISQSTVCIGAFKCPLHIHNTCLDALTWLPFGLACHDLPEGAFKGLINEGIGR